MTNLPYYDQERNCYEMYSTFFFQFFTMLNGQAKKFQMSSKIINKFNG